MGSWSYGSLTGPRALDRRRRACRNQARSTYSLKVAGEKRREIVMAAINQVAVTEINESARIVTIISYNPAERKIWWYGEFIKDGAIFNGLNLSTSNTIGQGNWNKMGKVKEGRLVSMSAFNDSAPRDTFVFLIGIEASSLDVESIPVTLAKPI